MRDKCNIDKCEMASVISTELNFKALQKNYIIHGSWLFYFTQKQSFTFLKIHFIFKSTNQLTWDYITIGPANWEIKGKNNQ